MFLGDLICPSRTHKEVFKSSTQGDALGLNELGFQPKINGIKSRFWLEWVLNFDY